LIHIVGNFDEKIFGLTPAERLQRQAPSPGASIVADAAAILDEHALQWLADNPGKILATASGERLAVATNPAKIEQAAKVLQSDSSDFSVVTSDAIGERFTRKLRRRSGVLAISARETSAKGAERLLFASVYKGITDLVTKWVWPVPAFHATKAAARVGLHPNHISFAGLALTVIAGWLFFVGDLWAALAAAWAMTFLDTVDGKLARVTFTSSRFGNWLDHGNDVIHPPLWWLCLAHGLVLGNPASSGPIWLACAVILGSYVVARVVEVSFHLVFGFNAFLFRPFDTKFRLVVARRNILLLIMTLGGLAGEWVGAFLICAAWSLVSTVIQAVRIGQAWLESRKHPLEPCLA